MLEKGDFNVQYVKTNNLAYMCYKWLRAGLGNISVFADDTCFLGNKIHGSFSLQVDLDTVGLLY